MTAEETNGTRTGTRTRLRRLGAPLSQASAGAHGCFSGGRGSRTTRRDNSVGSARLAVDHAGLGFCPWYNRHNTPLFIAAAFCGGHAHMTRTASIQDQLRAIGAASERSAFATKPDLCPHTPNTHRSEEQSNVTRHKTSALIFDELECRPFTENCRRPSSAFKIPRSSTPAMARKRRITLIRL